MTADAGAGSDEAHSHGGPRPGPAEGPDARWWATWAREDHSLLRRQIAHYGWEAVRSQTLHLHELEAYFGGSGPHPAFWIELGLEGWPKTADAARTLRPLGIIDPHQALTHLKPRTGGPGAPSPSPWRVLATVATPLGPDRPRWIHNAERDETLFVLTWSEFKAWEETGELPAEHEEPPLGTGDSTDPMDSGPAREEE